jgi:hypothetical protein
MAQLQYVGDGMPWTWPERSRQAPYGARKNVATCRCLGLHDWGLQDAMNAVVCVAAQRVSTGLPTGTARGLPSQRHGTE